MKKILLSSIAVLALGLATNVLIDPFYRFDIMSIPTVNEQRNQFAFAGRMSKAESICRVQPEQIVMGGSKIEIAIDPRSPLWGEPSVYNLGLAGMPFSELSQTFQFVARNAPLKRAVIGLDFLMFNQLREDVVYKTEVMDFDPDRISGSCAHALAHDWNAILGPKALVYSARTILTQHEIGREANTSLLASLWNRNSDSYWAQTLKDSDDNAAYWAILFDDVGFRSNFSVAYKGVENGFGGHGQEEYYVEKIWRPGPKHTYEFGSRFDEFSRMLTFAQVYHIDVRLFTEPLHARMLLAIQDAGLEQQFEEWKRGITEIAAAYGVPLYDFEAFSPITEEAVTPGKPTQWWWEPSHYKKEAGDLILNRLLKFPGGAQNLEGAENHKLIAHNFGVQLTRDNINDWLTVQRQLMQEYIAREPAVAQGVAAAVDASLAKTPTKVNQ